MNDNREIFEVPGVYDNPRRQTLTLAVTCKMSEIHEIGGIRHQIYQRIGINLDS